MTYLATGLSIVLGCQPIQKYWQINPDPGSEVFGHDLLGTHADNRRYMPADKVTAICFGGGDSERDHRSIPPVHSIAGMSTSRRFQ